MKGFDGNWQAQNFDTSAAESASPQLRRDSAAVVGGQSAGSVGKSRSQAVRPIAAAASSSGSRGEQNTDMDVVPELRDPVQARTERNAEEYGEFGAGAPAQSAAEGREEDDEFQSPRRVRFHDEQMYTISKEEREEHELLGHVQYRSWCRHCAAARGVGQQHRQLREDPVDATVPEIVLDHYFMGEESETASHFVVKDRKSSAYFSTSLDSKTSQYAVAFVAGAIQELGYKTILMKSDNEPANKRLKERVSECLPGVVCVPREAPVGDSRANGSAENAVKQVKGLFRTLKTSTEDRYSCKIDAKSCF